MILSSHLTKLGSNLEFFIEHNLSKNMLDEKTKKLIQTANDNSKQLTKTTTLFGRSSNPRKTKVGTGLLDNIK